MCIRDSCKSVDLVQYIAIIVIRRTLLSNLNDHITVIIQYYFASNGEHGRINTSYAMAWPPGLGEPPVGGTNFFIFKSQYTLLNVGHCIILYYTIIYNIILYYIVILYNIMGHWDSRQKVAVNVTDKLITLLLM